ncbi:glycosyl transferase family 1 [Acrocarpospora phusangensis]|uniref:Glycosyl transferase family 1 n=1 Tax=Acrocarpospora phusangensis TaxID=1070424 RepID=A0A919UPW6_9ACTN|nr:glycosyl transferase family 1 [Acrocarpospora phusangensis]
MTRAPARVRRVCLLIDQLGRGGTEKQLVLLAGGLSEQGVDVTVLVLFEGGPRGRELRDAGVRVLRLGLRRVGRAAGAPWAAAGNAWALGRLVAMLRRETPDVLHTFLTRGYLLGVPAGRLAGVPVVVSGRRSAAVPAGLLRKAAVRGVNRMTDLVIANAYAVANRTAQAESLSLGKLAVVYNGLPAAAFERVRPLPLDAPGPVLACVANLRPEKGQRDLLAAVSRTGGTVVLAGEGPEREALAREADRLGVDCRFLGAIDDVRPLLYRADAVVLPSLVEGLSNAVMEAMAAGRPVIATAVGGTPELLGGSPRRGLLVPPKTPGALARVISEVLGGAHPGLGANARAWALSSLGTDQLVAEHIRLYGEQLERLCAE